jgi:hypothetical protein
LKFEAGVKVTVPALSSTVPPTGEPTATTFSAWPDSLAGPGVSFASSCAAGKLSGVSSAAVFASGAAVGLSFTAVTVSVTVATFEASSPSPAV